MLSPFELLRKLKKNQKGNAIVMTALGMPVLVGGAGFAVDTAQWYLWKREMQHAVDQAAIAGAWAMANPDTEDSYATRAQQEYASNVAIIEDFDEDPTVAIADYAGGTQNSVVVRATASKELPFSGFIMGGAARITVTAQASFQEGATYNACLISLTETGTGTSIGGSSVVNANCGLAALSCDENAMVIDGSSTVVTESIAACGTIDAVGLEDIATEGVQGLSDAYKDLEPPTNDEQRVYSCSKGKNKQASLEPGTYKDITTKCETTLATGIYVIDGGTLDLTGNYDVTGNGVMFVLRNGANIKLGGSGQGNKLNLTPMTASDLFANGYESVANELEGILVFEDRDNNSQQDHILNGNQSSVIEGLVYLPDGHLRVNGTADVAAQCLQISAFTIDVRGGAFLETLCPTKDATEVGTTTADIRLVG